jgi:predicted flap endonuclease-1-like 5' DNA nuclease
MPKIRWTRGHGRRVLGEYVWDESNGYVAAVHPDDALEVLTNPDFELDEDSERVTLLKGVGDKHAQTLLDECGIADLCDLLPMDATTVSSLTGIKAETVAEWQKQAREYFAQSTNEEE